MSNIVLSQPGGGGTLAADGSIGISARCYLSASGVTALSWTLLSKPAGSSAAARLHSRNGWYFDPDLYGEYEVQLTDTLTATHTNTFTALKLPHHTDEVTSSAVYAASFGVTANGRRITDGAINQASNRLTSATANFTTSDVGKSVLLRVVRTQGTGSLASTSGSTDVTGTGVNLPVDLPIIGGGSGTGQPESGGAIYITGLGYVTAQFSTGSGGHIVLAQPAGATVSGASWYKAVQVQTTITRYISATEVELNYTAILTESSVRAFIATDDTDSLDGAIKAALSLGIGKVILPPGLIGMSRNLVYTSVSNLTISGPMAEKCTLVDLRKSSDEVAFPNADVSYGILSFNACTGIHLTDMGFDASLPSFGIVHSAGGVANASGSRVGFFVRDTTNSSYVRLRSEGFGARDEHCYVDGDSSNFTFDRCDVVGNNNVSLNCNAGFLLGIPAAKGLRMIDCRASGILVSAGSYVISGCDITGGGVVGIVPSITVDCIGNGIITGNTFHDIEHGNGVGLIDVFGNADTDAILTITGNTFRDTLHPAHTGGGAVIHLDDFQGTAFIAGNTSKAVESSGTGGRFIFVEGSNTGTIHVGANTWLGETNMTVGVRGHTDVPVGSIVPAQGTVFGAGVTTKWSFATAANTPTYIGQILQGAFLGDTSPTLALSGGSRYVLREGTLTANRSPTLSAVGAVTGEVIEIERRDVGNFTYAVVNGGGGAGTKYTFPVSVKRTARFKFDGTDWQLHEHFKIDG